MKRGNATRTKKRRWASVSTTNIDDPREDRAVLRREGIRPRRVPFTELLDDQGRRWVDHHDGDGPILVGGVPEVTEKT